LFVLVLGLVLDCGNEQNQLTCGKFDFEDEDEPIGA